jgi:hypothetical protein
VVGTVISFFFFFFFDIDCLSYAAFAQSILNEYVIQSHVCLSVCKCWVFHLQNCWSYFNETSKFIIFFYTFLLSDCCLTLSIVEFVTVQCSGCISKWLCKY